MANYNAARTVIGASLEELITIFRWVQARGEDERDPLTVLIGGWAVYCYNPWYGSVDIDLVTNSRARHHLMKYLREERGFTHRKHPMIPNTVAKYIPEGEILIDFGSREDTCRFEGRAEECPFSLLDNHTEVREIRDGSLVVVPERTLLLVFKLKAAWDRSFRLRSGTSYDREWELGKMRKDKADILALLDPASGGTEVDIRYLGELLQMFPFLGEILANIPDDREAVLMYRRMDQAQASDVIKRLLLLVR
jgi:hypothetical protein